MEPLPAHPIVAHIPIALAIALPVLSGAMGYAVWRGKASSGAWAWVLAAHFVLFASAGAATLLGEADGRRIQTRMDAAAIDTHEGDGKRVLLGAAVAFVLALAGLVLPSRGHRNVAMAATFAAALACAALAVVAGHGGAVLVYRQGAGAAWSEPAP